MSSNMKWLIVVIVLAVIITGATHLRDYELPPKKIDKEILDMALSRFKFDKKELITPKVHHYTREQLKGTVDEYLIYNEDLTYLSCDWHMDHKRYTITFNNAEELIKQSNTRKWVQNVCHTIESLGVEEPIIMVVSPHNREQVLYIYEHGEETYFYYNN